MKSCLLGGCHRWTAEESESNSHVTARDNELGLGWKKEEAHDRGSLGGNNHGHGGQEKGGGGFQEKVSDLGCEGSVQRAADFQCNRADKNTCSHTSVLSATHQFEDFEEVQVGVEDVLDLLQPLLAHGAHGVADAVEAHAAGKEEEPLQQGLAAGDVLQLQVGDAEGKLWGGSGEAEGSTGAKRGFSKESQRESKGKFFHLFNS